MKNNISKKYKVVIECSTYNQKEYIAEALDGIIKQNTDFPFCAIVIDDCSTDGQQSIIREYAQKFPDIIIPIFLPYNHFSAKKSKKDYLEPYFKQCEYIAKCEGDDYWTDENKLQIQADFLDANPDCALTYHACCNKFEPNYSGVRQKFGEEVEESYDYIQLLQNYRFQTATIMFRSNVWFHSFFQQCYSIFSGDVVQYFAASQLGSIRGINKKLSVYRRCNSGISKIIHQGKRDVIMFNRWFSIAEICPKKVRRDIHRIMICSYLYEIHKTSLANFFKAAKKEIRIYPEIVFSVIKRIIKSRVKHLIFAKRGTNV